ncbi:ATP phosphoribosyltransferase regulatory subunit [Alkalimonas collagenimarina]|uniref:site-specific DNA-methyltransferase (adenine-specific) n=1 Tax=Alkalimonas collagenimarina TaxID=400390 RepID=A0ABT9H3K6_9GAMM|nr:type IIL restriction-modification enzyme MmeI [Alkalimonas collagenimarina]MDP4537872.1 ATP phosphoribosyltransferase regulatory subunit [Alkalimonas collagenimarina]
MSAPSVHDDWLSLIEISGPFLAVPTLKEAFPQGLEELDANKRIRLRQAYEEWREALELEDAHFGELHVAWVDEVLSRGLELDEDGKGDVLKRGDWCAANLKAGLPEYGLTLSPNLAVVNEQGANKPLLLIQIYAQDIDLDATLKQNSWSATPADRMVQLCRSLGCRLGLVTNGERWMLVDAPVGAVTSFASWYARIWSQEPITLQAFVHLLGIRRFFVDESEQLPALFDRSLKFQDEVTDALGEQVRRAVEVLIQTLDKADQDRNRGLLHDVKEPELYEAALTVMMRLVFLLSAEERGLLLMGDERYEANYALSTLRMQLRKESEEILERRWDAWSRLLAIFRAVFGGIEHENLRLPALGGSLFDPDRFPFLEGRAKGSSWRIDTAKPLPIDNRTVLLLLEAIQQLQGRTLSYRALDVEQIGYVYEGLLERTVKRTDDVTLELEPTKSAKTPWVKLAELDSARLDGAARLAKLLQERSGSSASRVRNDLVKPVDDTLADRLLTACLGDTKLRDRVKPYAHLLRTDPWGYPLVYTAGAFIVTTGSDRRETGTHYTPKSLTEAIVVETLTPVVYVGPAERTPRDQWVLKSPAELLNLKICDPAMGSGAFLVQACRWLSDRLVESWSQVEALGKTVSVDGEVLETGIVTEFLPQDSEARKILARRLIAERCLYGVDLNPLAVELAKLSIWLITLAKGRPFGFLDHNLRYGDSLLGVTELDQMHYLDMKVGKSSEKKLFTQEVDMAVKSAIQLRKELRTRSVRDVRDLEAMEHLNQQARSRIELVEVLADALVGETLKSGGKKTDVTMLAIEAGQALSGCAASLEQLKRRGKDGLRVDFPNRKTNRKPFHWCLEFPEVFVDKRIGFDAVVGNPPFVYGKNISSNLGRKYNQTICEQNSGASNNTDLSAHFISKARIVTAPNGVIGFISTSSICEGETRRYGLDLAANDMCIYRAATKKPWPGSANVYYVMVWLFNGVWYGDYILDSKSVVNISPSLTVARTDWSVKALRANEGVASRGVIPNGKGFLLSEKDAKNILRNREYSDVIKPYLVGSDINSSPQLKASRYIINFWDWPISKAQKYPLAFQIVQDKVKPVRDELQESKQKVKDIWWLYEASGKEMYALIGGSLFEKSANKNTPKLEKVIAIARTSKTGAFALVDADQVFAELTVLASGDLALLGVLQSSIHMIFAWDKAGKMKEDLRYSPSLCFLPFPLPEPFVEEGFTAKVKEFNDIRSYYLKDKGIGLTNFYKRFHDKDNTDNTVLELRELHKLLDELVLGQYGWQIDLGHGFHSVTYLPEGKNTRFTISEEAREELLYRLAMLNKARHEVESINPESKKSTKSVRNGLAKEAVMQDGLFDEGAL